MKTIVVLASLAALLVATFLYELGTVSDAAERSGPPEDWQ